MWPVCSHTQLLCLMQHDTAKYSTMTCEERLKYTLTCEERLWSTHWSVRKYCEVHTDLWGKTVKYTLTCEERLWSIHSPVRKDSVKYALTYEEKLCDVHTHPWGKTVWSTHWHVRKDCEVHTDMWGKSVKYTLTCEESLWSTHWPLRKDCEVHTDLWGRTAWSRNQTTRKRGELRVQSSPGKTSACTPVQKAFTDIREQVSQSPQSPHREQLAANPVCGMKHRHVDTANLFVTHGYMSA